VSIRVSGFSHVTIDVRDLTVSLRFYLDVLGMRLVHQGEHDAYLEWGSAWICLQERHVTSFGAPQTQQGGVDHVAFSISTEDFDDAVAVLQEANVPLVRGPVARGTGWSVNFRDPDGTELELHTATLAERMTVWR